MSTPGLLEEREGEFEIIAGQVGRFVVDPRRQLLAAVNCAHATESAGLLGWDGWGLLEPNSWRLIDREFGPSGTEDV